MAEASPAPFLKFEDEEGREIPLISANVWKIGRGEQNAVVLIDDMVSRNHAMIQQTEDGEFYLIDMDSANGSLVNERKLTAPTVLRDGDHLAFGKSRLCFRNPAQPAAASPSPESQQVVSVVVMYLREFTVVAQDMDTGVLSQLVSTWSAEVDRLVHYGGGTAQKHLGDSVVSVWTHGAKGREHIEILRILRAVAGVARMTATLHESFDLSEPLSIGAGVNTELAAIGDTVNAAFRLQSAIKELDADLVIGASTFDYLRTWPDWAGHLPSSQENLKGDDASGRTWQISFAALSEFLAHHREDTGTTAIPTVPSH
ncbi:MAG: adenylate/guanylate cyclase domain-containing protein [Acidobacteriia bacterium]|nr:adenylate/guanylate cyclase domain-containing protein [Terriglobia bacterium]